MAKTFKGFCGIVCTEIKPGLWEFNSGEHRWRFANGPALNLFYVHGDTPTGIIRVKDLLQATAVALGWDSGYRCGRIAERVELQMKIMLRKANTQPKKATNE